MYSQDCEDPAFREVVCIVPSYLCTLPWGYSCLFLKEMCRFHYNHSASISTSKCILGQYTFQHCYWPREFTWGIRNYPVVLTLGHGTYPSLRIYTCQNDLILLWWKKEKQEKLVHWNSFQMMESWCRKSYFHIILCDFCLWNFHYNPFVLSPCHEQWTLSNLLFQSDIFAHKLLNKFLPDTFFAWSHLQCPIFRKIKQNMLSCFGVRPRQSYSLCVLQMTLLCFCNSRSWCYKSWTSIVSSSSNWSEKQAELQKYECIILKVDICRYTIEYLFFFLFWLTEQFNILHINK